MIADWQRAKAYTNEYLNSMPADKYSFRAVDSIRSFAQQMLHLAQANLFFLSTATGTSRNFGRNLEQAQSAASMDSVKYFVNASYDYVIDGITKLDAGKLGEKVSMRNMEGSRLTWLSKAFDTRHITGDKLLFTSGCLASGPRLNGYSKSPVVLSFAGSGDSFTNYNS